ncbi:MAG: TonB-dependent receptor, partial [Gammaproteobacteria bacterium]|nr:TonB-dependent receptor [Gammaproteobacteria bacterium]
EIVTVGIRSSLTSSMNMKRGSQGLVDGIVSEDIGKFPDTNLAESMQRIAGVSIDRSAQGEGQRITVRGMGPDFNLVTLNGRQMPASRIEATAASNSRAFDFSNLASEAIAAIEIKKTSRASDPTGGIGATVNIKTARPLDTRDTVASFGVKMVADQSVDDGDSVTPEISGIFSTTNDDETFGVSVTASYQDRNLGYNQAGVAGYWLHDGSNDGDWTTLPPVGTETNNITNRPAPGEIYMTPQTTDYTFNDVQRERINGQLALQFAPSDTVTATLDYTYSENTLETQRSSVGAWYNFLNNGDQVWTDTPVATPLLYSEDYAANDSDLCFSAGEFAEKNENNSLGLNIVWDVSDRFGLEFDYHDSDAKSAPDSPLGSSVNQGVCGFFRGLTTTDFSSDFPVLSIGLPPGADSIEANRNEVIQTGRSYRNSLMESDVQQAQLSGELIFEDDSSLDFGIVSTEVSNRSAFSNVQTETWSGFCASGQCADEDINDEYPDEIWGTVRSTRGAFDNMPGNLSNIVPGYFDFNFEAVRQAGIAIAGGDDSTFRATNDYGTDRLTDEDSIAAYLQYNRSFDIGNKPANIAIGVRYEQTDVISSARVPIATNISWNAANEYSVVESGSGFTTLKGDYDYVLPSVDFDIEVGEDKVLRASYSETIGRPGWGDIQGGQTLDALVRINGGTGRQGDPGLLPLESQNYDLSFEWYYTEGSYASIAYFRKDIDNYVGNAEIVDTPFGLPHPGQGPRFIEAQAAVGDDFNDIRDYIFANYGNTPEVDPVAGTILGIAGEDPISTFRITVPANQQSATVDGWEFSVQHLFGDSPFGASVNFTLVESDVGYDNNSAGEQFAIEGISDSANAVVFYEDDRWSARIAYNWRDEFLNTRTDDKGANPQYTDEYGQWDANVSFNVNEDLSVFVEGINLTDEIQTIHGRDDRQLYWATQTGARYMIGARYNFR